MKRGAYDTSQRSQLGKGLRYTVVVVAGLAVDLSIAMTLRVGLGTSLVLGGVTGFLVAVAFNYVLFEAWVFRREHFSISLKRLALTYVSATGALGLRFVLIVVLNTLPGEGAFADFLRLGAAAVITFAVNFLVLRHIFKPPTGSG